jgi:uncharacterized membrane protein YphA (DoxX/SURF4 family)
MWEILLNGVGGTLLAITAIRIALGAFFIFSGGHKLLNAGRHQVFVETLRASGIHFLGVTQWFVPGVEFFGGLGVAFGFLTPLAALGLFMICLVAILTNAPRIVAGYKPIDFFDRIDDWLYQPEVMYALVLVYFITAGAGAVSIDQLIETYRQAP